MLINFLLEKSNMGIGALCIIDVNIRMEVKNWDSVYWVVSSGSGSGQRGDILWSW